MFFFSTSVLAVSFPLPLRFCCILSSFRCVLLFASSLLILLLSLVLPLCSPTVLSCCPYFCVISLLSLPVLLPSVSVFAYLCLLLLFYLPVSFSSSVLSAIPSVFLSLVLSLILVAVLSIFLSPILFFVRFRFLIGFPVPCSVPCPILYPVLSTVSFLFYLVCSILFYFRSVFCSISYPIFCFVSCSIYSFLFPYILILSVSLLFCFFGQCVGHVWVLFMLMLGGPEVAPTSTFPCVLPRYLIHFLCQFVGHAFLCTMLKLGGPIMAPTICGSTKGLPFEYLSPPFPSSQRGRDGMGCNDIYVLVTREGGMLWLWRDGRTAMRGCGGVGVCGVRVCCSEEGGGGCGCGGRRWGR